MKGKRRVGRALIKAQAPLQTNRADSALNGLADDRLLNRLGDTEFPAERLGSVLRAIAHPMRRRILELLMEQDLSVGTIAGQFRVSRTAVIKHLNILRSAKLISVQRRGLEHLQSLNPKPLETVKAWLSFASGRRRLPRFVCLLCPGE